MQISVELKRDGVDHGAEDQGADFQQNSVESRLDGSIMAYRGGRCGGLEVRQEPECVRVV